MFNSLSNFTNEELRYVARLRNVDGNENVFRQQLENMFTMPSAVPIPYIDLDLYLDPDLDLYLRLEFFFNSVTRHR